MNVLFNRWTAMALLAVSLIVGFFWRDATERTMDSVAGFLASGDQPAALLRDQDVGSRRGYHFERERNDERQIEVGNVRLISRQDEEISVSLQLSSRVPNNDYPNLRITLKSADGVPSRSLVVAPDDYRHQEGRLGPTPVPVDLHFLIRSGEAKIVVDPTYGAAGNAP